MPVRYAAEVFKSDADWTDRLRELEAINADFRVVVLFDSARCRADAASATSRVLSGVKRGTRVDVRFWECETMAREENWEQLHSELRQASAIVIATEGESGLSGALPKWDSVIASKTMLGELVVVVFERGLPFLFDPRPNESSNSAQF